MEETKSIIHWKSKADYEKKEEIIVAIKENEHSTQIDLAHILGVDPKTFRKHIRQLVAQGKVIEKKMGPVLTYILK